MLRARMLGNKPRRAHTIKVRIWRCDLWQTSYHRKRVLSSRMKLCSQTVLYIKGRSRMASAMDMVSKYGLTERDTKASGSTTLLTAEASSSTLTVTSMMVRYQKP